jgi:chloride channel 3/4/5
MSQDEEANEQTHLLDPRVVVLASHRKGSRRLNDVQSGASSIISPHVAKEEQELAGTAVGERLPYNDYTTIDWLHDLVILTQPDVAQNC